MWAYSVGILSIIRSEFSPEHYPAVIVWMPWAKNTWMFLRESELTMSVGCLQNMFSGQYVARSPLVRLWSLNNDNHFIERVLWRNDANITLNDGLELGKKRPGSFILKAQHEPWFWS